MSLSLTGTMLERDLPGELFSSGFELLMPKPTGWEWGEGRVADVPLLAELSVEGRPEFWPWYGGGLSSLAILCLKGSSRKISLSNSAAGEGGILLDPESVR